MAASAAFIDTLSLHDALPIFRRSGGEQRWLEHPLHPLGQARRKAAAPLHPAQVTAAGHTGAEDRREDARGRDGAAARSEEHTSELQSRGQLVCRPLLHTTEMN